MPENYAQSCNFYDVLTKVNVTSNLSNASSKNCEYSGYNNATNVTYSYDMNTCNGENICDIHVENVSDNNVESDCDTPEISLVNEDQFKPLTQENNTGDELVDTICERRQKHPKNLIISHVNINSVRNKFEYVYDLLSKGLIDVLCITETKLDDSFSSILFACQGYKCYRKDRNMSSGGMMIFIREDIPHNRMSLHEIESQSCHIECMVFHFQVKKFKFYVICTYKNPRVPNHLFVSMFREMLNKLDTNGDDLLVMGDFNIDMIKDNNVINDEICDVYGLKNIIKSATCFKSEKGTLIDPLLVSNTSKFCVPFNVMCGVSDWHNMVGCVTKIACPIKKPFNISYRSYKTFNETNFKGDINQIPSQVCEIFDDVSDQFWAFNLLYVGVLNEHAPLKQRIVKAEKIPYMYSDLMKQMYKRNMLRNKYIKSRNTRNWEIYRKQRNYVTSLRKKAIKTYFMKKCSNISTPKDFWNCIKPFFSDKCNNDNQIILKENNEIVNDPVNVANVLNDYFVDIAKDITGSKLLLDNCDLDTILDYHSNHPSVVKIEHESQGYENRFNFHEVSCDLMCKKLKSIKTNRATGHDCINPASIKLCANEITMSMTSIVNYAFKTHTFPCDMKISEVSPIYKKKDHMRKENYRPINLITAFSKIFESIIADQINDYMHVLFNKRLGAYRKGHGCSQMLTLAVNNWKWALDNNMYVGALLMDLSKAFDSIPHDLLICKMYAYGFSRNACDFMMSYLSYRRQRVKVKDSRSEWKMINRGIPQG